MAIHFNTRDYEFSSGHSPRGRGTWCFSLDRNPDMSIRNDPRTVWTPSMNYGGARRFARQEFQARGFRDVDVYVQP